jgi:ABC-type antimicrobial peptide transport system permease subunit
MQPLFAQMDNEAEAVIIIGLVLALIIGALLLFIFYLLTLQKALSRCRPQNRTMEPGQVWLNLIPFFNIVWQFITVSRVSSSLTNEFRARGRHRNGEDYGQTLGMTAFALNIASVIPLLGLLCALAALICWIIYWSKVSGFSAQLASSPAQDYYEDEDDYSPRDGDDRRDRDEGGDGDQRRPWDRGAR